MNAWLSQTMVHALGWTLVHFLWEGLVIAALLAVGLRIFKNRPAHYKYLAGCAALALMAIAPAVTLFIVAELNAPPPRTTGPATSPWTETTGPAAKAPPSFVVTATPDASVTDFSRRLEMLFPWLVLGWVAGVCALSGRLLSGWLQVRRLRRTATHPLPPPWPEKLAALAQRLGVNRPVQLLQSALIEVPTVIGWLRPVVLLPVSCVTGLTPRQLESIIAHELAHIRRHDYLINLLQSAVETLLFYHPAVWWVSRRIRDERENCCDDLAVEASGDLVGYARALATLEELRPASAQLMLAAAGAPLLQRIRRLAGQPERSAGRASWPVAGIALLLVLGILAAGMREHRVAAAVSQLMDGRNTNNSPSLEVRTFHVDPNIFIQGLEGAVGKAFGGGNGSSGGSGIQFLPENDHATVIATAVRSYFASAGVDLSTNEGEVVIFNDRRGTLTIRATSRDLDLIETALQTLLNSQTETNREADSLQTEPLSGGTASPGTVPAANPNPAGSNPYVRTLAQQTQTSPGTVPAANPNPADSTAKPTEINIKSKFVEIATAPGDTNTTLSFPAPGGLMTEPEFKTAISALEKRDGTKVLSAPEITTLSGRQAQMQIGNMQTIVTLGRRTNAYNTTNMLFGQTLDAIATVSKDKKSISMTLIPSVTEFLGYTNPPTGPATLPDGRVNVVPLIEKRTTTANATVWDGQTIVIGGFVSDGTNAASQPVKKELLIFVTANVINPDGTLYNSEDERISHWTGAPPQISTNR